MLIGELAALGTAISFSFGSVLFTFAGRRFGSPLVNRMRLLVALVMIILMHLVATGQLLPLDAAPEHWFWLGISGLIGFVLGDALLFQGFVMIGPRLSMLMMALAPVIATVLGWIFLDEILSEIELLGIALTVGGIMWVVLERSPTQKADMPARMFLIGLLFAFGGAVGQAAGLVTSSIGLRDDFLALSGNVIRLSIATLAIWTFTAFQFRVPQSFTTLRSDLRATAMLVGASLTGPVIGVWLSLIAVQLAPVGIASTIMSLTPIFLIPISYVVFHEQITRRMVVGTIIAFAGTALLFL
jgi:drug/metabolite transporter (DMT)-like permease